MDAVLFGRYFLEFALLYPGAYLCLAPLRDHLKAPKTTYWIAGGALTALCLVCAALCTIFELPSNVFLLPILIVSFRLLRWRTEGVTVSQMAFLFSISAVMLAVCSLMAVVLNARAETGNQQEANLVSTALLALGLSAVLSVLFHFTAVRWSAWLLQEYHGEAFWQSAWPLPAIYAAFLIFCIPLDPSVVLLNRIMIIAVLAVSISLLGIFLLLVPGTAMNIVCYALGGVVLVCAAVQLVRYFAVERGVFQSQLTLISGLVCLGLGAFLIIRSDIVVRILPIVFGLFVIFDSLGRIQNALELRKCQYPSWKGFLLLAVLSIVLGIVMILDPFGTMETLVMAIGVILIVEGALNLLSALYTVIAVKRFLKLHPETQSMLEAVTGEDLNGDGIVAPEVAHADVEATAVELDHVDESAEVEQEDDP